MVAQESLGNQSVRSFSSHENMTIQDITIAPCVLLVHCSIAFPLSVVFPPPIAPSSCPFSFNMVRRLSFRSDRRLSGTSLKTQWLPRRYYRDSAVLELVSRQLSLENTSHGTPFCSLHEATMRQLDVSLASVSIWPCHWYYNALKNIGGQADLFVLPFVRISALYVRVHRSP